MLTIRLSRTGKSKQPQYRLIVSEKTKDPWGTYLENLGTYNPRTKEALLKEDRIKYWIAKGAETSATVHNLLLGKKLVSGEKMKKLKISKRRKEKLAAKQKTA